MSKEKLELRNPFIASLSIKAVRLYSKKELIHREDYDTSDGIVSPKTGSPEEHEYTYSYLIESEQRVCLYRNEHTKEMMKKLTDRGCRMLTYILQGLPKNSDSIEIDCKGYMDDIGLDSSQTFYNAVNDLILAGVIAKMKPKRYWINPAILFNGSRLAKFKDNTEIEYTIPLKNKGE